MFILADAMTAKVLESDFYGIKIRLEHREDSQKWVIVKA